MTVKRLNLLTTLLDAKQQADNIGEDSLYLCIEYTIDDNFNQTEIDLVVEGMYNE